MNSARRCRRRRPAARPQPPRPQYLELKASVHRKLLNRLNLEALAQSDRVARGERDPHAARRAARRGGHAAQPRRARDALRRAARRRLRARAARAAAARSVDQRHPGQHLQERLRRARRQAREGADDLPGRPAPDARHRPHRQRASAGASTTARRWSTRASPDGSRVNAIIPPLAVDGPLLSIRRFPAERLQAPRTWSRCAR